MVIGIGVASVTTVSVAVELVPTHATVVTKMSLWITYVIYPNLMLSFYHLS